MAQSRSNDSLSVQKLDLLLDALQNIRQDFLSGLTRSDLVLFRDELKALEKRILQPRGPDDRESHIDSLSEYKDPKIFLHAKISLKRVESLQPSFIAKLGKADRGLLLYEVVQLEGRTLTALADKTARKFPLKRL